MSQNITGHDLYWQYRRGEKTLRELGHVYRTHPSIFSRQFGRRDETMLKIHGLKWFIEILRKAMPNEWEIVKDYATRNNLLPTQALEKLGCTVSAYQQEKRKDPAKFLRKKLDWEAATGKRPTGRTIVQETIPQPETPPIES